MSKKRGLGKGLDALLGSATSANPDDGGTLRRLPVDLLQRGRYQPRRDMDPAALQELADSIRSQGILQPLVVRAIDEERYEIVAGERRWRAAQLAGLDRVPAIVREIPDEVALAVGLIENIQREDLNPLEEAFALERLIDEFGMTHQAVSEAVGRSRAAVSNLLRLLELNDDVKRLVAEGRLEMGHARALAALKGGVQSEVAARVVARALSVRATESIVRKLLESERPGRRPQKLDPDIRRLQDDLTDRLGASVQIQQSRGGAGKLVIQYTSLDELDGILGRIR
ncbi:ParB family chromosome partitioning protein [Natronocella acetinitrilica]|uniref:Probable chromosome-partitioning protein ParB n=2 Tax=Natronocella acetinitrilica TaxID=414046 RepID=A0AAE3G1N8_9GAMM|nr:ParB/RepB/Spo0J family partition protein [Natronocella acetinitrilica]MCP1673379.1 ParB family chromosome partitioning protein [Natronocella acetinitrilica]